MKLTQLLAKPEKESPKDEDLISAKLLLQAGYIQKMSSGSYTFLPLGFRVLEKIENIIREELDQIGAQELLGRIVQPASIWRKSGRLESFGPELISFKNRKGQTKVLAPTHEEAIAVVIGDHINSYKDLPLIVNQIQTKYRDEIRPRGGLIRVKEFIMQDAYSFDGNKEQLDKTYHKVRQAYQNIFNRCGLETLIVDSDVGAMGGTGGEEFMVIDEQGEDRLMICPGGDYQANLEVARFALTKSDEKQKKLEEIDTPETKTIDDLCQLLTVEPDQTAKMVFYQLSSGELVSVAVRGDLEVNEVKLANYLKVNELKPADEDQIIKAGVRPGYASPNNFKGRVIIDPSVEKSANLVIGANQEGRHLKNYNFSRDYQGEVKPEIVDIAQARAGLPCPICGAPLEEKRGIEVGHIFKLGQKYSRDFGLKFLGENGHEQIPQMGCYGIGLDRLMATIVQANNDQHGVVWPEEVTPYDYHLLNIGREEGVGKTAIEVYKKLKNQGKLVLFDDRDESPGVKFNDADLIGCSKIITVSKKTIAEKSVEIKNRKTGKKELVLIDKIR